MVWHCFANEFNSLREGAGVWVLLVAGIAGMLSGCSGFAPSRSPHPVEPQATVSAPGGGEEAVQPSREPPVSAPRQWWFACTEFTWLDADPSWGLDLYIADLVVRPVLEKHGDEMELWRVHRRARRDAAGHRFCFIYYATEAIAGSVAQSFLTEPALKALVDAQVVATVWTEDVAEPGRQGIAATSDPNWPGVIARTWPKYIMGVSEMWLGLIEEMRVAEPPTDPRLTAQLEYYGALQDRINRLWSQQGQHVFLHHLNAIFGYQPILIQEQRSYRF